MELSFTRIGLLIKKQFIENKKLYLFGIVAIMGTMSFVFLLTAYNTLNFETRQQVAFFGIGMISFGCLFTLTLFSKLDKKEGRLQSLMVPATMLEKLIAAIFYGSVLFPLLYIVTVYPFLIFANYVDNHHLGHVTALYVFNDSDAQTLLLSIFYILQTMVLLFSVLFRKNKVVQSVALLVALFYGTALSYPKIIDLFLPTSFNTEITAKVKKSYKISSQYQNLEVTNKQNNYHEYFKRDLGTGANFPFRNAGYYATSSSSYVNLEVPFRQKVWFYILLYLSIPLMWTIIWLRLKESEIN